MLSAYDIDLPTGDTCSFCNGKATVSFAGVDLCRSHADQEMPGWESYLPTTQEVTQAAQAVQTQTVQGNCLLCGSWGHKPENCPRANR